MIETYINKHNYKELDKHLELISLTYDKMFKGLFLKNKEILKKFILTQIDLDIAPEYCKIEILNNELPKDRIKEYQKVLDIYVLINNYFYVNLEINRSYYNDVKLRNLMYDNKNFGMLLDESNSPKELINKHFVQINLNTREKDVECGSDKIIMYGLESKKRYFENKYILIKYLEYYRNLYYTYDEDLNESDMWLVVLTSRNFYELGSLLEKLLPLEEVYKFIEDVIRMCTNKPFFTEWEKEKLNELVEYQTEVNAIERGLQQGIERGLQQGLQQGIEQGLQQGIEQGLQQGLEQGIEQGEENKTIELIKNMLSDNLQIEKISLYTGKSQEEILKIKESI